MQKYCLIIILSSMTAHAMTPDNDVSADNSMTISDTDLYRMETYLKLRKIQHNIQTILEKKQPQQETTRKLIGNNLTKAQDALGKLHYEIYTCVQKPFPDFDQKTTAIEALLHQAKNALNDEESNKKLENLKAKL